MKKFMQRVRDSKVVKCMICAFMTFLGICRINDLKDWLEKVNNNNMVKEVKEFTNNTISKVREKAHNMSINLKDKAQKVSYKIQDIIDKVQDYTMNSGIENPTDAAAVLTSIFILTMIMFIGMAVALPIMIYVDSSKMDVAINIAIIVFATPGAIATVAFSMYRVIKVPNLCYQLYQDMSFSALKKNAYTIYMVHNKLFEIFEALSIFTILGFVITRMTMNGLFSMIYEAFAIIAIYAWRIGLWVMWVDGIILCCYCIMAITISTIKDRMYRKTEKGKRIKHWREAFTLKHKYVPKRLAQGSTSLKGKEILFKFIS